MSLTYVIPDIHGRFDLMSEALHRVHAYAAGNGGTLIMIGDYVDKGPDSNRVIARLRRGMPDGWAFIPLKGNHDAMMAAALRHPARMTHWLERGGDTVIRSYGGNPLAIPEADIAWLEALPRLPSGKPPDSGKILPRSMGRTRTSAPAALARRTKRSCPR